MDKISLLVVSANLAQGGNERWIFEVCKAIDKDIFDVGVLTSETYLNTSKTQNFSNFYYHELRKLGIPLYEYLASGPRNRFLPRLINRAVRLARHLSGKPKGKICKEVWSLLRKSDVICVIDFYNYATLKDVIHETSGDKFFIVLHSHKIQFDFDPYVWFEKDLKYRFTYACPKQVKEIGSSGISQETNSFFFNPLVLNLSTFPNLFRPISNDTVIFSVFTRIARTKPVDVFVEAFARAQQQISQRSFLYLFGEIQDAEYHRELLHKISELKISPQTVQFLGHSQNMAESIKQSGVNVYWGHAMNASCGYASIEVGAMGVPSFYWNNDPDTDFRTVAEETQNAMFVHNSIDDFVAENVRYVRSEELLADLSARQRRFFVERHDIAPKIKDLEHYILSIHEEATS